MEKTGDLYFEKNIAKDKLKIKRDEVFEEHKKGNKASVAKNTIAAVAGRALWGK